MRQSILGTSPQLTPRKVEAKPGLVVKKEVNKQECMSFFETPSSQSLVEAKHESNPKEKRITKVSLINKGASAKAKNYETKLDGETILQCMKYHSGNFHGQEYFIFGRYRESVVEKKLPFVSKTCLIPINLSNVVECLVSAQISRLELCKQIIEWSSAFSKELEQKEEMRDNCFFTKKWFDTVTETLKGIKKYYEVLPKIQKILKDHESTKEFKAEYLWMMFIDYKDFFLGPFCYENEKGFLFGIMNGYHFISRTLNRDITLEYIETLWKKATKQVTILDEDTPFCQEGYSLFNIASQSKNIALTAYGYSSEAGVSDLINFVEYANRDFPDLYAHGNEDGNTPDNWITLQIDVEVKNVCGEIALGHVTTVCHTWATLVLANHWINWYKREISEPDFNKRDEGGKIRAITMLCQQLARLHLFRDGNARMLLLLLTKELIRHGMSPALLESPKIFRGCTFEELITKIGEGQADFKFCSENPEYYIKTIIEEYDGLELPWPVVSKRFGGLKWN